MKVSKMLLLTVVMTLLFASQAFAYDVQLLPFKDEENDYAKEPIYTLSALGIIDGYEDRTYRPRNDLSREAFVKLLVVAAQAERATVGRVPADVAKDRWSALYISVAYERGWIASLLDSKEGNFQPSLTITRQEVAMLIGVSQLEAADEEVREQWLASEWKKERDARAFKDASTIDAAMQPYVYYATRLGIMEGDPTGFKPRTPLIRKQAAAVIYRLLDQRIAGQKVDFTGYYAIASYPAIGQVDKLSDVIYGWSHLQYDGAGSASLNTSATEFKIPGGYGEAIEAADKAGATKELMVFYAASNLKDFLKDQPARQAFTTSLLATLNNPAYSFTGVSIDFEGLKEAGSAADFVGFLKELKAQLGTLTLSVAVPPIHYYKGYDLGAIGKLADTVILMAYDFTHDVGMLPSAPLPLVNDTVRTALKSIPKDKLVLGISKQANQWITAPNGVTGTALKPSIADVEKRLAMPGVTQTWSMPFLLKKAEFKDARGSHVLYYEDSQSIEKKIWLAKYYGLKGVSLWHMGNYTASDWEIVGRHAS
ncbi:glycosyl hydrolase family 18 protein [Paenibacillus sp. LHD-117]|uniref:S-layer homology domain-containing protein n=1 Tax=Paenibacillus sp. LHD-117 TaxID=3071412 RepID=UPI0027E1D096|nr:S-layer homology domain-containing protein [Paenibacillus sp. LHD-117]MDQ6423124.1 glycosyl hydrolase family 18 protein [Paenibacillus sp. LHD-117]